MKRTEQEAAEAADARHEAAEAAARVEQAAEGICEMTEDDDWDELQRQASKRRCVSAPSSDEDEEGTTEKDLSLTSVVRGSCWCGWCNNFTCCPGCSCKIVKDVVPA